MEWLIGKFSSVLSYYPALIPIVKAEDEESQDPQEILRAECKKSECSQWLEKLETCNSRVLSKKKTRESCHEEMVDYINCLDKCVSKVLFTKLK